MKQKFKSTRWILLAVGIIAVVGLTAMNVYSLYTLRNSNIETERQSKQIQISEFADRIRYRFFKSFYGLSSLEMQTLEQTFQNTGQFTEKARNIMLKASEDSIFTDIYYFPSPSDACQEQTPILRFNPEIKSFESENIYPSVVCDGMGIARTRMKSIIGGYRYNNKVLFDTHRSMVLALVNQNNKSVVGYLAMPINQSYMINRYLQPKLSEIFGDPEESGISIWLRNWTNGKIIASNNPNTEYTYDKIEIRQKFPDFFDDWRLYASVNEGSMIAASSDSLWINMLILSVAFIFLIGAMIFMFYTAQQERALASRQSDFLANVTHELKTPISVMQAAGENLADGRVDNQSRLQRYGSHIYSEAVRLRKMIDKLLDVAKADAGVSFIHPKPIAINTTVEKFLKEHQSYFQDKGFTLDTSIPNQIAKVMVDESSINTVLSNLLSNAMKYSNGDKFLGIYLSEKGKDVILQVEDHGVGMSKNSIKHIFEKFYRAEDTLTAQTKGYGLGLSIVQNLVDLNGGTVSVNSKEGEGSTFTITFPVIKKSSQNREQRRPILPIPKIVSSTKKDTDYARN